MIVMRRFLILVAVLVDSCARPEEHSGRVFHLAKMAE